MSRVAIVAALEREVRPLTKKWHVSEKEYEGRKFRFFENNETVLVCGGIGAEAARRSAQAVIALYQPKIIYSVGFAGALDKRLRVGDIVEPARIIDASDGSSIKMNCGEGLLVSFESVATAEQKKKLADSYGAQAVDMEAAAVATAAEAGGAAFAAIKVVSDETEHSLPSMERFIDSHGQLLERQFAIFAALRPWLWISVLRLGRNSARASRVLCERLRMIEHRSSGLRDGAGLEVVNRR